MSHASDLIETDILAYLEQHERKEILRFLTCGSVDDGKSTLIGRLLHDSRMIYEDQLEAIRQDSRTIGTQRGGVDLALLVDGLQAEREQGITIDVAYRYFSTARRKFIIADTPGHEQYTRNMVTGASTCDVAIILIDANNGVLPQTRRHSYIAQLLGIRHLIVAVNKMDDVSYEEPVFDAIREDYFAFASKLPVDDLDFIPISALLGDNVVEQSANMPWYQGATLMHLLETIPVAAVRDTERLRLPVQYVNRPDADFRGYCGSIVGGVARPGDVVTVLPSGRTSTIARVVTADGDVAEAFPPMAVTVTLDDAVDVSRGDVIAGEGQLPHTADRLDATVVWMAEEPLVPGKPYRIKHGARQVMGQIGTVRYHTDINTLAREPADTLALERNRPLFVHPGRALGVRRLRQQPRLGRAHPHRPHQQRHRRRGHDPLARRLHERRCLGRGAARRPARLAKPRDPGRTASAAWAASRHGAVHRPRQGRQDRHRPRGGEAPVRSRPARNRVRRPELPLGP